ncbi:MAG TPA: alternative ribosome rescue aminoacyl-tRNA hydrolase ArfB [Vicinamibacterales bacterium]|nr:alternative ribosome rescue aminoacyl-tRNA hydrolase ArfB [Vicinamibacterales bacterium]
MLEITPAIRIDDRDLRIAFVRSSGPGGQNVNKVATAVQLRFDAARSTALPEAVRARLRSLAGRRMTEDGVLIIDARRFRTQEQNRRDAVDRLTTLLRRAAAPPIPRRPSKPTRASKERRLESKLRRARVKEARKAGPED